MSSLQRRFEILLPQRFNDGSPVPDKLFAETILQLRRQFHAVSSETQIIRGVWEHAGQSYRDDLIRVFVDVDDTVENEQHFRDLKEQMKARFQQIDIRMTSHLINAYRVGTQRESSFTAVVAKPQAAFVLTAVRGPSIVNWQHV